ncbi:replication initiation protein [Burkholderia gladioli]|uniref:replication initiation protein n=1 Tax=Burkholderia gladioli TaxID=28095 RepID=UPI001FC8B478|nr:replication initiation protein [Burkholderia gladioli]MDA0574127.1 replication initiation protein [Burkholderia gladioli]MDA0602304.1 replication initiation protein [Burkholderia gladioli]MDC6127085.1 replication initiation protein [Burkholderia gladioli]
MASKKEVGLEPTQIALFQLNDLPEPFRKAVPAVHIAPKSGPISLQQAKMWNALIKNAIGQNKDGQQVWFDYAVGDLIADVGLNSKNRDYVKATINSLLGFVVNWDYLSGKPEWNASSLIAGAKLSAGILRYQFSDNIRELLMNPRIYASIDMRIAREFKRGHALTLWENVVRYEGVGRTPRLSVETIRDLLLGVDWPQGSYAQYKIFKSRILLPALEEINRIADHEIAMHEFKTGRTITEVQFVIEAKRKQEVASEEDLDLLTAITRFSVPLTEARKLLAQHGPEAVRQAIGYTDARLKKKNAQPIENVGAYFRKSLAGGYQAEPDRSKPLKQVSGLEPSAAKTEDVLLAQLTAERANEARRYFDELEAAEQSECMSRYNDQQPAAPLKLVANRKPKKSAESAFFQWLSVDVWGEPTDRDLLNFVISRQAQATR